jgi:small subunit ribosomal protein S20
MANHVSALKRARQTEFKTERNRANTSRLRTALRAIREATTAGDKKKAEEVYRQACSAIDKAAQKGVLHKNTASRYKSRLKVRVNKVAAK